MFTLVTNSASCPTVSIVLILITLLVEVSITSLISLTSLTTKYSITRYVSTLIGSSITSEIRSQLLKKTDLYARYSYI